MLSPKVFHIVLKQKLNAVIFKGSEPHSIMYMSLSKVKKGSRWIASQSKSIYEVLGSVLYQLNIFVVKKSIDGVIRAKLGY